MSFRCMFFPTGGTVSFGHWAYMQKSARVTTATLRHVPSHTNPLTIMLADPQIIPFLQLGILLDWRSWRKLCLGQEHQVSLESMGVLVQLEDEVAKLSAYLGGNAQPHSLCRSGTNCCPA